jgi:S1-C subfamily serine protease
MSALKLLVPLALVGLFAVGVRADDKPKADEKKEQKKAFIGIKFGKHEDEKGFRLMEIIENSPAAKAGLEANDVLLKIDGKEIDDVEKLRDAVQAHKPGDKIKLTIKRSDKEMEVTVTAGEMPADFGKEPEKKDKDK